MKIDVNVNVALDAEVLEILKAFKNELRMTNVMGLVENEFNESTEDPVKEDKKQEEVREEKKSKKAKTGVTKEAVRAKLAELNKAGKQSEVKTLIKKYDAAKLSEIDPENYESLMVDIKEVEGQ